MDIGRVLPNIMQAINGKPFFPLKRNRHAKHGGDGAHPAKTDFRRVVLLLKDVYG
jgi:hypothetical protein